MSMHSINPRMSDAPISNLSTRVSDLFKNHPFSVEAKRHAKSRPNRIGSRSSLRSSKSERSIRRIYSRQKSSGKHQPG
jgi:hypothetical protein